MEKLFGLMALDSSTSTSYTAYNFAIFRPILKIETFLSCSCIILLLRVWKEQGRWSYVQYVEGPVVIEVGDDKIELTSPTADSILV